MSNGKPDFLSQVIILVTGRLSLFCAQNSANGITQRWGNFVPICYPSAINKRGDLYVTNNETMAPLFFYFFLNTDLDKV